MTEREKQIDEDISWSIANGLLGYVTDESGQQLYHDGEPVLKLTAKGVLWKNHPELRDWRWGKRGGALPEGWTHQNGIENINWPGGPNPDRVRQSIQDSYTLEEQRELGEFVDAKWQLLHDAYYATELPNRANHLGDLDYVTFEHIIGYGRKIYEAALDNVSLVEKWRAIHDYDDDDPTVATDKSFYRCLPETADREQIDAIMAAFRAAPDGLIIDEVADILGQPIGQIYRTMSLLR
jgi:hypothetical protein